VSDAYSVNGALSEHLTTCRLLAATDLMPDTLYPSGRAPCDGRTAHSVEAAIIG